MKLKLRKIRELQAVKRIESGRRTRRRGPVEKQKSNSRAIFLEEKSPAAVVSPPESWVVESASRNAAFCRAMEKLKANGFPIANQANQGVKRSTAANSYANSWPAITSRVTERGKSSNPTHPHSEPALAFGKIINGKPFTATSSSSSPIVIKMEMEPNAKPVSFPPAPMITFQTRASNGKTRQPSNLHSSKGKAAEPAPAQLNLTANGLEITALEMMRMMPSVTTTGNGPSERRIEGFLFSYAKGKVSIVCICHGKMLSPSEFIRHAGGVEVQNPMKHIKVLPAIL